MARSDDCSSCFLSTTQPLDLSGYKSVTLSLHRWVDAALGAGEFLAIEIGNDGIYKRLDTYTDGGGVWRYETYSLAAEDLTDNVTLRLVARPTAQLFFRSVVKTLAIDNVLLTGIPVPVEQLPNLAVTAVTAPATIESGGTVRVQATIRNDGGTEASARSVRVYRHASSSADPTSGAEVAAITTGALAAGASVIRSVSTTVLSVTADTTFYYYVCVDTADGETATDDNCAGPAEVRVRAIEEEEKGDLPNLTASSLSVSPTNPESGTPVTVQVTIQNNGTADAESEIIRVYRHLTRTSRPAGGGARSPETAITGVLAPGAQVTKTITISTPTVTTDTAYYYYVCVDVTDGEVVTDDNCSVAAEVWILPPLPPLTLVTKEIMGGDVMTIFHGKASLGVGTITLGGVETIDGTRGFIGSGHVISHRRNIRDFITNTRDAKLFAVHFSFEEFSHLLGLAAKLPQMWMEGEQEVLEADAGFIAYPHPGLRADRQVEKGLRAVRAQFAE